MHNAILYQAYGGQDFVNECRYSLLKYLQVYNLKPPASTAVVIYTDAPNLFSDFLPFFHHLHCKLLLPETVKKWSGSHHFVHRVKIEMMRDFVHSFTGNLLYCDTDTYLTQPIEPIFKDIEQGDFYLHEYEGMMNKKVSPSFHKWEDFLASTPIVYNGKTLEFSRDLKLFNAGVVGLGSHHKPILDDVLALTDTLFEKFPKHIAEQFAFDYCFQKSGTIKRADYAVAHYWNLKEFRQLLSTFFKLNLEESIPNLVKKVHHLDAMAIMQHKTSYKRLPFLQRFLRKMAGSAWEIRQYEKKLL